MPNYDTDAGLLEHLRIQSLNIADFKSDAGADDADVLSIHQDYENLRAILEFCPLTAEYKSSAYGIKEALVRGAIGTPIGTPPNPPIFAPPHPLVAGIEKRSRERDGRFKRSKTMTEAGRMALDLNDEASGSLESGETVPTVVGTPAQSGYIASIVISNRGRSDMWKAIGRRMGSETWFEVQSGTGKSADIHLTPTTPGQPEKLEMIIQLYKNNKPFGPPSAPIYLTFNP